jgi:hypothetical protein
MWLAAIRNWGKDELGLIARSPNTNDAKEYVKALKK